jgi:hypothetical protein
MPNSTINIVFRRNKVTKLWAPGNRTPLLIKNILGVKKIDLVVG